MNEWALSLAVVVGCAILAAAGARLARRLLPPSKAVDSIPAAGAIYAVFGVIYGVILAQVVVAAWQSYIDAENAIADESDSLVSISRLAGGLPAGPMRDIRVAAIAYGNAVATDEWPLMQQGRGASPAAADALAGLYRSVTALPGLSPAADAIAAAALDELDALDDARGDRIVASKTAMPALMWVALIAGGVLTVAFTYLLVIEDGVIHLSMVVAIAALIALLLVLILGLSQPFRSPIAIGPEQFSLRVSLLQQEIDR